MEAGKTRLAGQEVKVDLISAMMSARRRSRERRGRRRDRTLGVPHVRLVLGHVHRQLDELPHRGARAVACRATAPSLATHADREQLFLEAGRTHRRPGQALLREGRRLGAAPVDRTQGAFDERHDPRHRHGRLHQHRAAHPGRGPGGRGRLHDGRHRRAQPPGAPTSARSRPAPTKYHVEDVHRAGGIMGILGELDRGGLLDTTLPTVHSETLAAALDEWDIMRPSATDRSPRSSSSPARRASRTDRCVQPGDPLALARHRPQPTGCIRTVEHAYSRRRRPRRALRQHRRRRLHREDRRRRRVDPALHRARRASSRARRRPSRGSSTTRCRPATW